MPYLDEKRKAEMQKFQAPAVAGDLNYLVTRLALSLVAERGECYDTYNAVIGALECAKLEMYRRRVAPYEDLKIQENGDVY